MPDQRESLTFDNPPLSKSKNTLALDVQNYVEGAFSKNTRKAYRGDLAHFRTWGGRIPANPELIASYLAFHAEKLTMATLARRLVAIGKAHTAQGLGNPCTTDLVRATFRGIKRQHGTPQVQARPLLVQDLLAILDRLGIGPRDARDKALLLLGFAGAFRRTELVDLNVSDFEDVQQGIVVTLRRSKTDTEGKGRRIGIPFARGQHCPVYALRSWLYVAKIDDGAIFRPVDRHGRIESKRLSAQAISTIVKARVKSLGHDPSQYSGHSLRAGLATSAALAGFPTRKIRQQTGHASEAMLRRYIREGELFRGNVAGSLL